MKALAAVFHASGTDGLGAVERQTASHDGAEHEEPKHSGQGNEEDLARTEQLVPPYGVMTI